jgi:hypothetical protein
MKNLNESHKRELDQDITPPPAPRNEPDVVPFQRRDAGEIEAARILLPKRQLEELRSQWATIQTSFVDEPRKAVEDADKLVADAIKQIQEALFANRANLEKDWKRNDQISTEDLRVSLQHYRQFFDRLVAITG